MRKVTFVLKEVWFISNMWICDLFFHKKGLFMKSSLLKQLPIKELLYSLDLFQSIGVLIDIYRLILQGRK